MAQTQVGQRAPDFTNTTADGNTISLKQLLEQSVVVLFFYPKDDSPICTAEACQFRDSYEDFVAAGATVIGVSGDTEASHRRFAERHGLPFLMISDTDGAIRKAFRVPRTLGLLPGRVTYVIDRDGIIRHELNSAFSSSRHVNEALEVVKQLQAAD